MKTLANCNPVDFLRQTNKIRHEVSGLLEDAGIMEIRKRTPDFTGKETADERKDMISKQAKKNLNDMLDALMEKHAEQTTVVLGMMCFMEPDEIEKQKGIDFIAPALEILGSNTVVDFLTSLGRLGQRNTED